MRDEPLQLDATNLFPPSSRQYSIEFGRKVSLDSGGNEGPGDSTRVFDLDGRFASYRAAKESARSEDLAKYYCTKDYSSTHANQMASFIASRLLRWTACAASP